MNKRPEFTHAELIQLWHAISEMAATSRATANDPMLTAREKLDDYVIAKNVKPVAVVPLCDTELQTAVAEGNAEYNRRHGR